MPPGDPSIRKTKYDGVIDADGHVLEAGDLWEKYAEDKYKPFAVRLRKDGNGYEYLEIGGKPSKFLRRGVLGMLGAMGLVSRENWYWDHKRAWGEVAAFGAVDQQERMRRLEAEGLAAAIIYPTIGLGWEVECEDLDLAQAMTRAYNRWIVDWCSGSGGRLVPVAHLSLSDPVGAARELERAVKDGCKGGWFGNFTHTRTPHGHPDHDALFAKAQELGVPLGIHPTLAPLWTEPGRFDRRFTRDHLFTKNVLAADATRHALTTFFEYATFDRFPRLKIVLLESGAGWISNWLDRMDDVWNSHLGHHLALKEKPSVYFARNVWISADPDEHILPATIELCGEDKFFWASDFPHPDHIGNYIEELEELAEKIPPSARRKLLGDNVARLYKLSPAA
jgi:predicted TIM-barrel fold metal-dependent hydrolase